MRVFGPPALALLSGLALAGGTVETTALPRGALYAVVRSCVLAKEHLGTPFPCLAVEAPSAAGPGYAVVRAPGSETHIVVVPTDKIPGIEDPRLQAGAAGAYWRAAAGARDDVRAAAGVDVPLSAIGLAINSQVTRSQDQLHIHAECVRPDVLRAIRAEAGHLTTSWKDLPHSVDRDRFEGRIVTKADLQTGNVFAMLAAMPGTKGNLSGVVAVAVESGRRDVEGEFILLASRTRIRSVETFFDDDCRATKRVRASD